MGKFELKIDLNVLNHLGLNLYSNLPAVLSELIANAWDADAKEVKIMINSDQIIIEDDGCGMDEVDINDKFLYVGYQRRKDIENDLTKELSRKVMGRKGIGKLSIFSIAEYVEVFSKKTSTLGFSMSVADIRKQIDQEEPQPYFPTELRIDANNQIHSETGTRIVLRDIKKRVQSSLSGNVKKRVARRFNIWSDDFVVSINGERISIEDRDYFHKLEFATVYGDYSQKNLSHLSADKLINRNEKIKEKNISGWIGLVKESGGLQDEDDNLNKISILARGKVALEDILEQYRDGGMYTKYIIGEIRADYLDDTDKDDIATSSRQDFITSDERFIDLKNIIFSELKFIEKQRAKYKEEDGTKKAREIPAINEWFQSLKGDRKKAAKKLFGKINLIATDDKHRKTLYKYGVLAFEHLRHKEKLQQLEHLSIENLEQTVELFSQIDDIEATWYYEITQGRLEVINTLTDKIDKDALEKYIQLFIYNHLWLLDPSWEKATEVPRLEQVVTKSFKEISEKLTQEEQKARVDIRYRKVSGKHIIIELKRASVKVTMGALFDQVKKYKSALRKQLEVVDKQGAIECICLLGELPQGWENQEDRQTGENALAAEDIRVITYEQLINNAQAMYKAYLDKDKDKGRIGKLLNDIDTFDETEEVPI